MINRKVVLGILLAGALILVSMGFFVQFREMKAKEASAIMSLPNRDIGMYEVVSEKDLINVRVPRNQLIPNIATRKEDIVGHIARNTLYAKTPIPKRALAEVQEMQDVVFITVHTDYARSGGAKVGDRVDVDMINTAVANNIKGITKLELAKDARVVSVTDQNGTAAYSENTASPISTGKTPVQAIKLAIKPSERTAELEYGAVSAENGLVLTVKYDDQGRTARPIEIIPESPKEKTPNPTSKSPN